MKRYPMTPAGYMKLKEELERIEQVEIPENIREIEEARAHGDLRENAEYDTAKERQAQLHIRVQYLRDRIANAEVIDPSTIKSDRVLFGATVTLENLDTGEQVTYQIVGEDESDLKNGRISVQAPIARALIGKYEGDIVEVKVPAGLREYEILKIEYK